MSDCSNVCSTCDLPFQLLLVKWIRFSIKVGYFYSDPNPNYPIQVISKQHLSAVEGRCTLQDYQVHLFPHNCVCVCVCGWVGVCLSLYIYTHAFIYYHKCSELKVWLKSLVGWGLLGGPDQAIKSCFEGCDGVSSECLWWEPVPV